MHTEIERRQPLENSVEEPDVLTPPVDSGAWSSVDDSVKRRTVLKAGGVGALGLGLAGWSATPAAAEETATGPASSGPLVWRVSEPVAPGDFAVLNGSGLGQVGSVKIRNVGGRWQSVTAHQAHDESVKVPIPGNLKPGLFEIDFGGAAPVVANRPRIEWLQATRLSPGLGLGEVAPKSEVQIFGRQLTLADAGGASPGSAIAMVTGSGGAKAVLPVSDAGPYAATVRLPGSFGPGEYQVRVHNGSGGDHGWSAPATLVIKTPDVWPTTVFNAKDFGAKGDDIVDDTPAIKAAFAAAEKAGGGVVYFPYGTYRLTSWVRIPERVTLRGEGRDITWLKWSQLVPTVPTDIAPAAMYATGSWAIEDLSLSSGRAWVVVYDLSWASYLDRTAPVPELQPFVKEFGTTRDIFVRNARIHNTFWQGRPRENDPRVASPGTGDYRDNCIFYAGVTNVDISDNDFIGSHKFIDTVNGRIRDNLFTEGFYPLGWVAMSGQHVSFQDNNVQAIASAFTTGALPNQHIHIAKNKVRSNLGAEREGLLFDMNRLVTQADNFYKNSSWNAYVAGVNDKTINLANVAEFGFAENKFAGFEVMISDGRGAGQWRKVTASGAESITVDRPFDVAPDNTSLVLIFKLQGFITFYDNETTDASTLAQLYGPTYDAIMSRNKVRRTQGMWGLWGWFTQWVNNDLDAAVTYHTNIGPRGYPAERNREGGAPFGLIGYVIRGNLTPADNKSELPILPPKIEYTYVRGTEVRRNKLRHGHRILLMHGYGGVRTDLGRVSIADVLIDRNTIEHTRVGVELDQNIARVMITNNSFTDVAEKTRLWKPEQVIVIE